jgi:hypothetical protein
VKQDSFLFVGFEVFTPLTVKSTAFCDVIPYNPWKFIEVLEEHNTSTFRHKE